MPELYVPWSEYHQLIEQLALKVYKSGWQFNQIICLARGGLRVGDVFSRMFQLPLAILSASSYTGDEGKTRGNLTLAKNLTMTSTQLGSHVLLVDDLLDSGYTLKETQVWLRQNYPDIIEIKTAVLWHKACSIITPDYCVEFLPDNPWIHQPFEIYENVNWDELAKKFPAPKQS
jgi:hypoxanthine phosphoribosyltransferase